SRRIASTNRSMARSDTESVPPTSLAINKTQRPSLIDLSLLLCSSFRCYREFLLQVVGVLIVGSFCSGGFATGGLRVTEMSSDQRGKGHGPEMWPGHVG